ncbi:MAG: cbb3-type cytochrome oxidase assembly protein CcoS [Pseudomonadales bacterium]
MQSLAILIPIALLLTAVGIAAFMWSVKSNQYDDLDRNARDILFDDDESKDNDK